MIKIIIILFEIIYSRFNRERYKPLILWEYSLLKNIESQYNLIKMLLAKPEKYKEEIDAIKKDIDSIPIELKKKT